MWNFYMSIRYINFSTGFLVVDLVGVLPVSFAQSIWPVWINAYGWVIDGHVMWQCFKTLFALLLRPWFLGSKLHSIVNVPAREPKMSPGECVFPLIFLFLGVACTATALPNIEKRCLT